MSQAVVGAASQAAQQQQPQQPAECDLVMKGGVTSGIVYPGALEALSKHYRFRNIGGTSAGAIAATFAAAAEYGRQTGATAPTAGFAGLNAISKWLGAGTNLQDLFQASPGTRPLMKLLLGVLAVKSSAGSAAGKTFRAILVLISSVSCCFSAGFVVGLGLALLLFLLPWFRSHTQEHWYQDPWFLVELVPTTLFAMIGGLIGSVIRVGVILLREVPRNAFGICRGSTVPGSEKPGLTDWLNARLNELAGLTPSDVLTIEHLTSQNIKLALVTSSLSLGRPYQLPLDDHDWIFSRSEMARYFPPSVVDHLIAKSRRSDRLILGEKIGTEYFVLPEEKDFPVIVAARMSLSFPVLFSAVPLYRPKYGPTLRRGAGGSVHIDGREDLEQCWFSDGGISSNFPIHFFDSWLPERPTFGINLRGMPAEQREANRQSNRYFVSASGRVFLPKPGHREGAVEWSPVQGLFGLIGAVWNTAQNFRDNLQASLPGYDERIVHIRLDEAQGGLNLTMPPSVVADVQSYGREAGDLLVEHFAMCSHQWTRMLMFLPLFETNLKAMATALACEEYVQMLKDGPCEEAPYQREADWILAAHGRTDALLDLVRAWKALDDSWHGVRPQIPLEEIFFPNRCPRTHAALRVVPNF